MQDRQTPRFAFALFLNTTFRQSLMLLLSVGLVLGAVLLGYLLALPSNPEAHFVGRHSLNRLLLLGGPLLLSLGCGGLLVKAVKDRPWARTPARSSWVIRRVALRAGRRLRYPCRSAAARHPPRRGSDLTSNGYPSIADIIWDVAFGGPTDRIAEFGDQELVYRGEPKPSVYIFAARIPAGSEEDVTPP